MSETALNNQTSVKSPPPALEPGELHPVKERDAPIDILLVDDREENLLALRAVLEESSYRLTTAGSGEEALRYLLDHEPALILLDVQMPGMDGFETAAIIKRSLRTRDIPIIFVTAINGEERYVHQGYDNGAVDYIQKPYDPHILRSKVAVFAELARKTQRLLRAEQQLREQEKVRRERRIAELEIKGLRREQAEQRKYRDLVDGIDQGIVWSADPRTLDLRFVSPSAERISGLPLDQWTSEPRFFAEHVAAADRGRFLGALAETARTGRPQEIEHRLLGDHGRVIWLRTALRLTARPSSDSNEYTEVHELRGLSMDISRIRAADELLQLSKRRSDLLAEASRRLGSTLDRERALSSLGELLVPEYAVGIAVDVESGDPDAAGEPVAKRGLTLGLAPAAIAPWPAQMTERDGAWHIPLRVRDRTTGLLSFAPSKDAVPVLDRATAEDLALRLTAALDAANLYLQARRAIAVRDEFLSIASHELRTPLTPLKIQTQSLLRNLKNGPIIPPERMIRMLSTSDRQLERLSRLIDDLLDVARITTGRMRLSPEHFDLAELLRDVIERYCGQSSLGDSARPVDAEIPASLPVFLDRLRVEQILVNLVTNALKYSQKAIVIKLRPVGDTFELSVRDHGIGIAPKDQRRIFERFERATTGSHFGGLGLGLFIVGEIVRAHHGSVAVESELGAGALFTVRLPLQV